MTSKSPTPNALLISTFSMVLAGATLALILGPRLDGFFKGMAQGAGVAIIVVSVAMLSPSLRERFANAEAQSAEAVSAEDDLWLPTKDDPR